MSKFGTIQFAGKSGRQYEFEIYPWGTIFRKDFGAVYFVTKRSKKPDGGYSHERIYVGQTEDMSTRFDNHHQQACFDKRGANCICVHGEQVERTRLVIERDLIENYHPPCNEKVF